MHVSNMQEVSFTTINVLTHVISRPSVVCSALMSCVYLPQEVLQSLQMTTSPIPPDSTASHPQPYQRSKGIT